MKTQRILAVCKEYPPELPQENKKQRRKKMKTSKTRTKRTKRKRNTMKGTTREHKLKGTNNLLCDI